MNTGRSFAKLLQSITSKNYLINNVINRKYAFKSNLKIKWNRPEKIASYKPEKSGDLKTMPPLDKTQYALEFRNSKELETADELVKKLFSLEFSPRWKSTQVYIRTMVDTVRRHPMDKGSAESRIARWTGAIRALQEQVDLFPRNLVVKVKLQELIDKRKKHLKHLRTWDYKRFEWVIENLNIVYKPPPQEFKRISRRDSLCQLTQKYCDDIVHDRLSAYKLQLQQEQPAFLQEKIRTLEFIRDEQKECGVDVTIKQEDIDNTKIQLNELLEEQSRLNDDK